MLEEVRLQDVLGDELLRLLHELVVVLGGEESPLELLDLVVDLDDGEPVDILGLLDLPGEGHPCLLEQPVVVPLLSPLLGAEQVPASDQGDGEVVLDRVDGVVGCEGPVRNEEGVPGHDVLLDLGPHYVVEPVEHDGVVDHAAPEVPVRVPLGTEVP